MLNDIGGTIHDVFAPLWFERPIQVNPLVVDGAKSFDYKSERFAVKCEEALAQLTEHPCSRFRLAKAMK